ncbi:MAG: Stage V sporulation protein E [Candidatus Yanofskybacteria bacterium GW2011_GWA2_41_22]|uniref:Probable peptidoglycan glycosyltransferase FtsW n=2 Tax=Candidatus Yanofskyibacteriota TaxID=1752733 RepID=A0A0G0XVE1_9BACT|nr:MAG: Stage V sporulation protein E [Candidatus Yanofskybacteria bacterium GW2011_GWA2_41_22]OGM99350.1 MAG: cell division protein FtsW [Candidatus Yanofskybacteria bacterium RIFCSPHIGHO2_01_FULL_41_27]OGN09879.1 MAG: cell division protein FtsW [Candidatus Yanofskybacteria bacterium RIFCSPHIGHO2_02_FULL_41_12]OGN20491.1 MAG: cell division protein FtsW [Candidatus Yanofskybacteria bacterium RIFCSPLOWO2_01_FULL_41_33]
MSKRLLWIILILIVFGLVVLSSAGIEAGQKKFNSSYYYVLHQIEFGIIPGLALMFLFSKFHHKFYKKISFFLLFFVLVLMILVFVPTLGQGLKGATRWLNVGPVSFQPSEILKLAVVLYLAAWFGGRNERIKNWTYGMAPFFIIMAFIMLLLVLQPDVGTLIVVMCIAGGIYFFAGISLKQFLGIAGILAAIVAVFIWVEPYRLNRIKSFINPSVDPRGISYQINQSFVSIGSGGLFGLGYSQSKQKLGFLPEVVGDSIFAVIAEELGFVGAAATIGLFVVLCFILIQIARNAPDKFSALLVMGMNMWIMSQAFINIAAISGLVPLTGIPLPFVSYGGTAIISLLGGLGIVLSVAKRS